jgi:hypothetical protein
MSGEVVGQAVNAMLALLADPGDPAVVGTIEEHLAQLEQPRRAAGGNVPGTVRG